jgi:hypothetical protein
MVLFFLDGDLLSIYIWLVCIHIPLYEMTGGGVECSQMIGHPRLMMILSFFGLSITTLVMIYN